MTRSELDQVGCTQRGQVAFHRASFLSHASDFTPRSCNVGAKLSSKNGKVPYYFHFQIFFLMDGIFPISGEFTDWMGAACFTVGKY